MDVSMESIVIQSDINNLTAVECFIDHICDEWHINNYMATITMSVLQAVENAVKHGNACDAEKKVTVSCDSCKGGLSFSVKDEGKGFDYENFSISSPNAMDATGIFLMKSLSDNLIFSEGGSRVTMDFMISGIESLRAIERMSTLRRFYADKLVRNLT